MGKKIHYHSDCQFFAGCENMLVNFFESKDLNDRYELSFSYRSSLEYDQGLNSRMKAKIPLFPFKFFYLSGPDSSKSMLHDFFLLIKKIIRVALNLPVLTYEIFVLRRLFLKINPDIVHVNSGGYPPTMSAKAAVIAAKLCKVNKVIMVVNNLAKDYNNISRILDYPIDRAIVKSVDCFITGSMSASNKLKQVLSLESKVTYIHNGIKLRKRQEYDAEIKNRLGLHNEKIKVFGVVALLIYRKGHRVLINAIEKIVKKSATDFIVLIEGSGPLRGKLEDEVKKKGLEKYCRFIGNEKILLISFQYLISLFFLQLSKRIFLILY